MISRKGKVAIACMIALSILISALSFPQRDVEIKTLAYWEFAPSVRVCAASPLSVHDVAIALAWWQDLGYKFDIVYSSNCVTLNQYGAITVTLDRGELPMSNLLGRTTIYSDPETKRMSWAIIELSHPYVDRVIEHEIGHALGWLHCRAGGHMMHPMHFEGGWNFNGLEAIKQEKDKL